MNRLSVPGTSLRGQRRDARARRDVDTVGNSLDAPLLTLPSLHVPEPAFSVAL